MIDRRPADGYSGSMQTDFAIVIPSYDPDGNLPGYVAVLRAACDAPILLVDDGSRPEAAAIVRRCAETVEGVSVAVHEANRGKGRALKTAFARLLEEHPGLRGCVTCDCDGQHAPDDVVKCLAALKENPRALVLGCRTFRWGRVPWKSWLGNHVMRLLFLFGTGRSFDDTQTGLRAIPADFMRELLECPGERFEFETRMLQRTGGRPLVQVPIQTLYSDGNKGTHFKPFRDSTRILCVLMAGLAATLAAFVVASVLSFGVDIGLFTLLYYGVFGDGTQGRLLFSVLLARVVSVVFNYSCNRYFVFRGVHKDRRFDGGAFLRYVFLAIGIMAASYALTRLFWGLLPGVPVPWTKAVVDLVLFLASFSVQRMAIFRQRNA
ncbi:MAG: bifunctional glycosyltransferase family 2/GtrA family protein [Kiritimatiellae bacterium]|nr:bifunctional glycosyltransferase family 2/GtrA family protein [Kiritimatiellia bacterium]